MDLDAVAASEADAAVLVGLLLRRRVHAHPSANICALATDVIKVGCLITAGCNVIFTVESCCLAASVALETIACPCAMGWVPVSLQTVHGLPERNCAVEYVREHGNGMQRVLVIRAPLAAARRVFDTVAAACADAARRPASAARRSPRGPSRPVLRPEVSLLGLPLSPDDRLTPHARSCRGPSPASAHFAESYLEIGTSAGVGRALLIEARCVCLCAAACPCQSVKRCT